MTEIQKEPKKVKRRELEKERQIQKADEKPRSKGIEEKRDIARKKDETLSMQHFAVYFEQIVTISSSF